MVEIKTREPLTALDVQSKVKQGKPGAYTVGAAPGLYLRIALTGTASWVLRTTVHSKRIERGIGGYPATTLAQARQKAKALREATRQGEDPKFLRQAAKASVERSQQDAARAKTFRQAADAYLAMRESGWRNPKHRHQWHSTLTEYVHPIIGSLDCRAVSVDDVLRILSTIWLTKQETAKRIRGRIENILDFAVGQGWRDETLANPAVMAGRLKAALPTQKRRAGVAGRRGPQRAMPWQEVPTFIKQLSTATPGTSAKALIFAILTAARSGEVRGMTWSEVEGDRWIVPAQRMKGEREHRVPLSRQACALLNALRPPISENSDNRGDDGRRNDTVAFPSPRKGTSLSDMALLKVCRDAEVNAVPHGFRSSFRDWCADNGHDRALAEAALAHALGDATEAAYQRSDMLERRRALMQSWADFVMPSPRS